MHPALPEQPDQDAAGLGVLLPTLGEVASTCVVFLPGLLLPLCPLPHLATGALNLCPSGECCSEGLQLQPGVLPCAVQRGLMALTHLPRGKAQGTADAGRFQCSYH